MAYFISDYNSLLCVKIPSGDVELSRFLAFTITGWLLYISGAVYLIIRGNDSNNISGSWE